MNPASRAEWISFVSKAADANHNGIIELGEHLVKKFAHWADFTNDGILDVIYHQVEYGNIGHNRIVALGGSRHDETRGHVSCL